MRIVSKPFLKSFPLGVEGRDGMGVTDLETTPFSLASFVSEPDVNIGRLGQTANGTHFLRNRVSRRTWLYLLRDVVVQRRVQSAASDLVLGVQCEA
jgi:hypothetical protein